MSSGNPGGKAVPDNRTVNLSPPSPTSYGGSGGGFSASAGGGAGRGSYYKPQPFQLGGTPGFVQTAVAQAQNGLAPQAPGATPGRGSAYRNQAFNTSGDPNAAQSLPANQQPGYQFNPFAATPGEELQRYLLGQGITSQTALNGAHGNLLNAQERNLNAQYGFTGREGDLKLAGAAADRAYIDKSRLNIEQLRQLYGEQKANEIAGLNQRADVNRRDINSKATAAGAFLFPGRGQHINDVNNDLANATQNSELSFRDKLLSLDNRGNELDNRNAKLDLIGQEVGLDRDKARAALDFGLAQLGYDRYVDSNKLLDMLNSGKAQEQAITNQILERVLKTGAEYQNGNVGDLYKQHTTTRWGINTGGN